MKTLDQHISELKTANPKPLFAVVNEIKIELTDYEYDDAIKNRAELLLSQEQAEADRKAKEQARAAVLAKLGLTADEAAALLG